MMKGQRKKITEGEDRVYADAAAGTPIHPKVLNRMLGLVDMYANPGSLYREALTAKRELERARFQAAEAIGAHPDEVIFTSSGTEANNLAIAGVLRRYLLQATDVHAIALAIEHQSVLEPLKGLRQEGLALTIVPVEQDGIVSVASLVEAIVPQTVLVSVQLVNSEIGTIQPLREIAKAIRYIRRMRAESGNKLPLYLHTDAAQAPLYIRLQVERMGVDLMVLDAQKNLGPKGVGILYRKRGVELQGQILGGGQEFGVRAGTENVLLAGACAEALTLAQTNVDVRAERVVAVRDFLMGEIRRVIPDVLLNSDHRNCVANNINISIPGLEGEVAVIALDAFGVAVSSRSACETVHVEPSHVLRSLGYSAQRAREAIRITLLPSAIKRDARRIALALQKARTLYGKK